MRLDSWLGPWLGTLVATTLPTLQSSPWRWPDNMRAGLSVSQSQSCCEALERSLGAKVSSAQDGAYQSSILTYWAAQESDMKPNCIVSPESKHDVSRAIVVLGMGEKRWPGKCQFAIRSGGHTPFAGSANVQGGITIDLTNLNQARLSHDKSRVTIGPGATWADVYTSLTPNGVATSGGRSAKVGVGGLTTGGGISFFSARYGFVCDNVENFEVVTSSGEIINANERENVDLWRALRGGSNNFGIVTSFEMRTFKQGNFWGGMIGQKIETRPQQFAFFENFTRSVTYDPNAALIHNYIYLPGHGWFISNNVAYTKSEPAEPNPPVFQPLTKIEQMSNTMRITNLTDLSLEIAATNRVGLRDLFATGTYANSAELMEKIFQLADKSARKLDSVAGLIFAVTYQPFPQITTSKGASNGGNSLGIRSEDGDMFNELTTLIWQDAKDDDRVEQEIKHFFDETQETAKEMGLSRRYLYLNYANQWQDVIGGYGEDAARKLREASIKYDPSQMFQKQVPGGFKLFK